MDRLTSCANLHFQKINELLEQVATLPGEVKQELLGLVFIESGDYRFDEKTDAGDGMGFKHTAMETTRAIKEAVATARAEILDRKKIMQGEVTAKLDIIFEMNQALFQTLLKLISSQLPKLFTKRNSERKRYEKALRDYEVITEENKKKKADKKASRKAGWAMLNAVFEVVDTLETAHR